MDNKYTPAIEEANRFLGLLDRKTDQHTFQTFDDAGGARVLHGSLDQHKDELTRLNRSGHGIFVTVNETNGRGRSSDDVIRVRALFADTDGAPIDPIISAPDWPAPHIVVESSPGRWHVYWIVNKGFPLVMFKPFQKNIARQFGTDASVHDLPRVMRLPGFYHLKGEPFMTRIVAAYDSVVSALPNWVHA